MIKVVIYISILFSLLSCSSNNLTKQDYIDWVQNPDNGLIIHKEIGNFGYELFYKPLPYQLLQSNTDLSYLDEHKNTQHYTFKIESLDGLDVLKAGVKDDAEYNNRLFYLADYIQQDFSLIQGVDTLPCLFAHYERNYGLAPFAKITLAFEEKEASQNLEKTIQFNDPVFGAGPIHFNYTSTTLSNIPNLKN